MSSATVLGSGQIAEWGRLFDPMRQDMEATYLLIRCCPVTHWVGRFCLTRLTHIDGPSEEVKSSLLDYGILTHLGKLMVLSVQLSSTSLTLNMMVEQCLKPLMVLS